MAFAARPMWPQHVPDTLVRMGLAGHLPRSRADVVVALVGLALSVDVCWGQPSPVGVAGGGVGGVANLFFFWALPLLLSVPLAWRRQSPLAAFVVIMGAVVLQAV